MLRNPVNWLVRCRRKIWRRKASLGMSLSDTPEVTKKGGWGRQSSLCSNWTHQRIYCEHTSAILDARIDEWMKVSSKVRRFVIIQRGGWFYLGLFFFFFLTQPTNQFYSMITDAHLRIHYIICIEGDVRLKWTYWDSLNGRMVSNPSGLGLKHCME